MNVCPGFDSLVSPIFRGLAADPHRRSKRTRPCIHDEAGIRAAGPDVQIWSEIKYSVLRQDQRYGLGPYQRGRLPLQDMCSKSCHNR